MAQKIRQPNLLCIQCYSGSLFGNICTSGYEPNTCQKFIQAYKCSGGLIFDHKYTKEECYECAKSCTGCMKMRVAYGFVNREEVAHLL